MHKFNKTVKFLLEANNPAIPFESLNIGDHLVLFYNHYNKLWIPCRVVQFEYDEQKNKTCVAVRVIEKISGTDEDSETDFVYNKGAVLWYKREDIIYGINLGKDGDFELFNI